MHSQRDCILAACTLPDDRFGCAACVVMTVVVMAVALHPDVGLSVQGLHQAELPEHVVIKAKRDKS